MKCAPNPHVFPDLYNFLSLVDMSSTGELVEAPQWVTRLGNGQYVRNDGVDASAKVVRLTFLQQRGTPLSLAVVEPSWSVEIRRHPLACDAHY